MIPVPAPCRANEICQGSLLNSQCSVRVAYSCKSTPVRTLQQVCLFSYGQTGAGKTHTMQGSASAEGRGITPRALEQVCPLTVCCAFDNLVRRPMAVKNLVFV